MGRLSVLGVCVAMVWSGSSHAKDDDTREVEVLPKGKRLLFAAELGTTNDMLGMGFDRDLSPTDAQGESHRIYPDESVEVPVNQYDAKFEMIENALSFVAHGRYLFVEAGVKSSRKKRYMVVRISQIDKVVKLKARGKPLGDAPMFASKVFYGWALYIVIEGEASTFTSDIAAGLMKAGAKLSTEIERLKLTSHVHAIGLKPKNDGEVVIATDATDVQKFFETSGEAQPIFVEYTLMEEATVDVIPWAKRELKPGRYSVDVDATVMQTKANGRGWDAAGNPPDPLVTIYINGKRRSACKNQDSYKSTCLRDVVVDLDSETTISLEARDNDLASHDYIGATDELNVMASGGAPGVPIPLKPKGQLQTATITLTPLK